MRKVDPVRTLVFSVMFFVALAATGWIIAEEKIETAITASCPACMDVREVKVKARSIGVFHYLDYRLPDSSRVDKLEHLRKTVNVSWLKLAAEIMLSISLGATAAKITAHTKAKQVT